MLLLSLVTEAAILHSLIATTILINDSLPYKEIPDVVKEDLNKCKNGYGTIINMAYSYHKGIIFNPSSFYKLIKIQLSWFFNELYKLDNKVDLTLEDYGNNERLLVHFINGMMKERFAQFDDRWKCILDDPKFTTDNDQDELLNCLISMAAKKNVFNPYGFTLCGIRKIVIEGTTEDWNKIKSKLGEYYNNYKKEEVSEWLLRCVNFVEEILKAINGNANMDFWRSLYRFDQTRGSGARSYVSGHILDIYYKLKREIVTNRELEILRSIPTISSPFETRDFPAIECEVKLVYDDNGHIFDLKFNVFSEGYMVNDSFGLNVKYKKEIKPSANQADELKKKISNAKIVNPAYAEL